MNNLNLEKRLTDIKTPDINLTEHRQALKTSLFSRGYDEKKGILPVIKDSLVNWLYSKQPVWKTASIGLVVIILTIILTMTIPSSGSESVYAKAMDIINYSKTIRKTYTIGVGDNQSTQTYKISFVGNQGTASPGEYGLLSITVPDSGAFPDYPGDIIIGKYNEDGESTDLIRLDVAKDGENWVILIIEQ